MCLPYVPIQYQQIMIHLTGKSLDTIYFPMNRVNALIHLIKNTRNKKYLYMVWAIIIPTCIHIALNYAKSGFLAVRRDCINGI